MFIFSLLGHLLDNIQDYDFDKNVIDDNHVSVNIHNTDIIGNAILPLCDDIVEERYNVIENGQWYMACLNFGKNPNCNRPELQSITFTNSNGDSCTCNVGEEILKAVSLINKDEPYFTFCTEIFYDILS